MFLTLPDAHQSLLEPEELAELLPVLLDDDVVHPRVQRALDGVVVQGEEFGAHDGITCAEAHQEDALHLVEHLLVHLRRLARALKGLQ